MKRSFNSLYDLDKNIKLSGAGIFDSEQTKRKMMQLAVSFLRAVALNQIIDLECFCTGFVTKS